MKITRKRDIQFVWFGDPRFSSDGIEGVITPLVICGPWETVIEC